MIERAGIVIGMIAGLANIGWLAIEDGGNSPLHAARVPITLSLIALAALAVVLEIRRRSLAGFIATMFGLLIAVMIGWLVCALRLPGPLV